MSGRNDLAELGKPGRGRIWYADFYDRGKRVQESAGTANRREAEKFYALRISEVERGEYAKPVKITVLQVLATFRDRVGRNHMAHIPAYVRITSDAGGCRSGDREGTAGSFGGFGHDALCAYEPGIEGPSSRTARL